MTNPTSESAKPVAQEPLYVIFDGPPSHESGRFVEVENERGESVKVGEWRRLPDGLWSLGPLYASPTAPEGMVMVPHGWLADAPKGYAYTEFFENNESAKRLNYSNWRRCWIAAAGAQEKKE